MIIIPAIDIKDGQCVRLKQGDFARKTVFSDDPLKMAEKWQEQGAARLHLVDLDGAKDGKPVNHKHIEAIAKNLNIAVQIGGGIRTIATIESYLELGISQVIIGTKAVSDPEFVADACRQFNDKIIVGLDARNDKVATQGWLTDSEKSLFDLASDFAKSSVHSIIYTDISKDGMMQGPNISTLKQLLETVDVPFVASGGISNIEDIKNLLALNHHNLFGAITGRAIYDNSLDLATAIALTNK